MIKSNKRGAHVATLKFSPIIATLLIATLSWLSSACAQTTPGAAQSYPSRSLRLIVPWPAGGTTDILGRIIGQKLSENWKQPVIVENRSGASGNIGTEFALKSPPDGYTLLLGTMSTHSMNQFLYQKMTFDPLNDLTPVSLVSNSASVLVAHPSLPARNVHDLLALARTRPGQLNFASGSSFFQLCGEQMKIMARVNLVHISYKGGGPAVTDLLGGHVETLFTGAPAAMPYIKSGRLRALAVTNSKRAAALPDVPTMGETIPGYAFNNWAGIMLPAGAPRTIVDQLNTEIAHMLKTPGVREKLLGMGTDPSPSTPEEFNSVMRADAEKMGKLIKAAGLRSD